MNEWIIGNFTNDGGRDMNFVNFIVTNQKDVLDILSLVVGGIGTLFGILSYKTAKNIYRKGIQNDCDSIYSQLGVEIVWNIIIPYKESEVKLKILLESSNLAEWKIENVYGHVKDCLVKFVTPYWSLHKGEVWDAIEKDCFKKKVFWKKEKDDECFNNIQNFFKAADEFQTGLQKICNGLETVKDEEREKKFGEYLSNANNMELINTGKKKMTNLDVAIAKLPPVLGVAEKYGKVKKRMISEING